MDETAHRLQPFTGEIEFFGSIAVMLVNRTIVTGSILSKQKWSENLISVENTWFMAQFG
jgi:hypothetical protein